MTRRAVFNDGGTFDDGSPISTFPSAVSSVFGRTGAVAAVTGDYAGVVSAFLTGATQASRYVGATTSGAPASGTFAVGDFVIAQNGHIFVCTVAGSPGTWVDAAAAASGVTSIAKTGASALTGAVTLTGGTNVTLTQSGNDISIASTAGGGGATEYDYVERTSNLTVTATSAATANTFITGSSVSYDGSTRIRIEFFAYAVEMTGANALLVSLWDGSTELGRWCLIESPAAGSFGAAQSAIRYLTPSNASHSYLVKAWKTGGTGIVYAGAGGTDTPLPAFLRITKA